MFNDYNILTAILSSIDHYLAIEKKLPMLYISEYLYFFIYDEYKKAKPIFNILENCTIIVEKNRTKYSYGFSSIYLNKDKIQFNSVIDFFDYNNER